MSKHPQQDPKWNIPAKEKSDPIADTLEIFFDCCKNVVQYSNNEYAKAYAKAGIELVREWQPETSDHDTHGIRVQCLYILNNITHWRGDLAKRVRADLKLLSRE